LSQSRPRRRWFDETVACKKTAVKILKILFLLLLVAGIACLFESRAHDAKGGTLNSYSGMGVVQRVLIDQRRVIIHHRAIANFMPEMTMEFDLKDPDDWKGILPGDEISFKLLVLSNETWIENIHRVGHNQVPAAGKIVISRQDDLQLRPGDCWPDAELMTEEGHRVHFSDFRGRILAFSFFFTRCPLPDYCPRMHKNFAEARKLLSSASETLTNYFFLSISFDPDVDTPERLAEYAKHFREGDSSGWLFAVASQDLLDKWAPLLGLMVLRQGANITHNLRTVVLDPQGRVYRQFDGNNWTPQDLAGAMQEARARSQPP
jgi:protein SCO1